MGVSRGVLLAFDDSSDSPNEFDAAVELAKIVRVDPLCHAYDGGAGSVEGVVFTRATSDTGHVSSNQLGNAPEIYYSMKF